MSMYKIYPLKTGTIIVDQGAYVTRGMGWAGRWKYRDCLVCNRRTSKDYGGCGHVPYGTGRLAP